MTLRVLCVMLLAMLAVFGVAGCNETEKKPLVQRVYEHQLKRCVAFFREERCEPPKDATYKEGLNHPHRIMVEGVKEMFPKDGTCSTHGATFLVCEQTSIVGRPIHILYKIDGGQMIEWSTHLYDAAEITEPRGPKGGAR